MVGRVAPVGAHLRRGVVVTGTEILTGIATVIEAGAARVAFADESQCDPATNCWQETNVCTANPHPEFT